MWQAEHVKGLILSLYPRCDVQILGLSTRGDEILDRSLSEIGGKGLFIKELEIALGDGRADLAVHSLKDMPMELPQGFELAAFLEREDPRDAFVSNHYASLDALPAGAVLGTSSLRRQACIAARFPHLTIRSLRGNVDTRLGKLDRGEYDAIVLAAAGLKRLGGQERIRALLAPQQIMPAVGQGALAIEIATHRHDVRQWCEQLNHLPTAQAVRAERALAGQLGGNCQVPLAAYANEADGVLHLQALVATPDGKRVAQAELAGALADPEALGIAVAKLLLSQGAAEILDACHVG